MLRHSFLFGLAATALFLQASTPVLISALTAGMVVPFVTAPAKAQSAEEIAKVAEAITVRIEGATQGSGVIVKKVGSVYTVLTAWHVIKHNRPNEEISVYTSDGNMHQLSYSSIDQVPEVDLALIEFRSDKNYKIASIDNDDSVGSGQSIFVSGFPLATSSVPVSIWRFVKGDVIAKANVSIPGGYQLLYSNPTLPGMSGGSVLNSRGELIAIHGKSEKDDRLSFDLGKAISTGTNQAVPIKPLLVLP